MPDHLHLLATPADATGLGQMMQWLGRYYVPYFNQKYGREGGLWNGRYKTSLIDAENFFITCCRYIGANPCRRHGGAGAGLSVVQLCPPCGRAPRPLITDHALYWALGNTPFDREAPTCACSSRAWRSQVKSWSRPC
jgi:putative transposase